MTKSMPGESSVYYPEGVIDTCIIAVSLFRSPLYEESVVFLSKVLSQEIRAAIPLTSIIGAIHIVTRYLRFPLDEAKMRATEMLETDSPGFYPYVSIENAIQSLEYALHSHVKVWDGYIIALAKTIGNNIVYTFDREFGKVKDLRVVNPFSPELMKQYYEYISKLRKSPGDH